MRYTQSNVFFTDSQESHSIMTPEKVGQIIQVVFLCTLLATILPALALADLSSICTDHDPPSTNSLPANGELRLKYVFVSFNQDIELTEEQHKSTTDIVSWYVEKQSHGNLIISSDSGIVFRPGEGFNTGDSTPYAWRAEKITVVLPGNAGNRP